MVNQARDDEDVVVVRYIEDYLDCVENLPNDLQRHLSRMLDLDATCQKYVREFDQHQKVLAKGTDTAARKQALVRIQKILIIMQDIGDEKLQIMQTIQDAIEKKARQLDIDHRNLKPKLEQENNEPVNVPNTASVSSNSKNSNPINEKVSRRGRRAKAETIPEPVQATDSTVLSENQSSNLPSTSNAGQKRTSAVNSGKRKKRKSNNQSKEESPPPDDDDDDDDEPDEPLYCICNQISFGKMIMCDNDSCALEWFHFSCVSLTAKPKGKWYCPQCRGSKPNIMKPKAQLR